MSAPLLAGVRGRLAVGAATDARVAARDELRRSGVLADDTVRARWDRELADELSGAGPLEPLLAVPGVTDVLVNGPDEVWIDCGRGLERQDLRLGDESRVRALAHRLAVSAARRLDDAQPWVDAALPDGTRLHAVLPPLTANTTISLRVLARRRLDLAALVSAGTVPDEISVLLEAVVRARLAFVISGGTGVGKTTLLSALLGRVPVDERVLTIEDAAEITTDHPHVVRLLARPANVEGAGAVTLADLVRQALRMRPDRIVVGEFRGAEMSDLLAALNTGHAGGAASVHANSVADLPARLEALGSLAGLDRTAVATQAVSALDLVVHLARGPDGMRRVVELGLPRLSGSTLAVESAWTALDGSRPAMTVLIDRLAERLAQRGDGRRLTPPQVVLPGPVPSGVVPPRPVPPGLVAPGVVAPGVVPPRAAPLRAAPPRAAPPRAASGGGAHRAEPAVPPW